MDILLSFFLLIISSVIGISLCLLLGMKSYLKIAILVMCIFIPMELYTEYINKNKKNKKAEINTLPIPNSKPNTIENTIANNTTPETTKYSIIESKPF